MTFLDFLLKSKKPGIPKSPKYKFSWYSGIFEIMLYFRYDQNWWIGRKVQIGCDIGFIPSPAKLETLRIQNAQNKMVKISANKQNSSANLTKFLQKKSNEIKQSVNHNTGANSDGDMEDEEAEAKKKVEEEPPPTAQSLVEQERKKKGLLGRKVSKNGTILARKFKLFLL